MDLQSRRQRERAKPTFLPSPPPEISPVKIGFIKSGYTGANTELKIHFARPCLRGNGGDRTVTPVKSRRRWFSRAVRPRFYTGAI